MKRFFSILICVALMLSLCACGTESFTTLALKHKVSSKIDKETTDKAVEYGTLLQENMDAAREEYDSEVGFAQFSFNHAYLLSLSNSIKDSEGIQDVSGYRYDLIKVAYIISTINYCLHTYSEDALYDETMKLLSLDSEGLSSNLEKSQAITDYAESEFKAFLKSYYRHSLDASALMRSLQKSGREEASSSS